MTQSVKEFYDHVPFPGPYSIEQLLKYGNPIENPYLRMIESQINHDQTVLDAGCGTGLITNLFAVRHPDSQFVGVDFANSVDYAQSFSKQHSIKNVDFVKQDLSEFDHGELFDVVICQGVLHHIPKYQKILDILKNLTKPGGTLVLGLYHPAGKIVKKFFNIDYKSDTLFKDQEMHPFEINFTLKQVQKLT